MEELRSDDVIALDDPSWQPEDEPPVRPIGERLRTLLGAAGRRRALIASYLATALVSAVVASTSTHQWRDHTAAVHAGSALELVAFPDPSTFISDESGSSLSINFHNAGPRDVRLLSVSTATRGLTGSLARPITLKHAWTTEVPLHLRADCSRFTPPTSNDGDGPLSLRTTVRTADGFERTRPLLLDMAGTNFGFLLGNLCRQQLDLQTSATYVGPTRKQAEWGFSFTADLAAMPLKSAERSRRLMLTAVTSSNDDVGLISVPPLPLRLGWSTRVVLTRPIECSTAPYLEPSSSILLTIEGSGSQYGAPLGMQYVLDYLHRVVQVCGPSLAGTGASAVLGPGTASVGSG